MGTLQYNGYAIDVEAITDTRFDRPKHVRDEHFFTVSGQHAHQFYIDCQNISGSNIGYWDSGMGVFRLTEAELKMAGPDDSPWTRLALCGQLRKAAGVPEPEIVKGS